MSVQLARVRDSSGNGGPETTLGGANKVSWRGATNVSDELECRPEHWSE